MKFIFGKTERKTERGILSVIQRCFPNAHEVFFSQGDVILCRNGNSIALLRATTKGNTTSISQSLRPIVSGVAVVPTRTKVTLYKNDFWVDHEDTPITSEGITGVTLNQDITEVSGFLSEELLGELAHLINKLYRPIQFRPAPASFGSAQWFANKAESEL